MQILHAINKVINYAASFSLLELLQLVPSVGELVWPFGNFFASFLCLRLLNISSICSRDDFDSVKCKARLMFCHGLSILLIDSPLGVSHCFSSSKFSHSLSSRAKPLRAFKVLQVGSFLLPLSLLKYFLFQT